ncbi:MAG: ribose-phosphate pyrophosphokinase [Oscillospiraceae bacterium]|jgi:ribose-phosphate pyrophosphokinase|nr:ribose-phosphate pyrophosphokinase [Oscillospiraceae bacterium]
MDWNLGLIVMQGAKELGGQIDRHLVKWAKEQYKSHGDVPESFVIDAECSRFASGDGKGVIKESIRGKDLFIVTDVGNYSCTYQFFGKDNRMSPDDHYQDLKRIIQAASGKARRISVIMPLLYGGRQHKRNSRESLDSACALQELERIGVENIVTFDAHDPRVQNAVPFLGVDNVIPSYQVLKTLFRSVDKLKTDSEHFMVVSPDEGAMSRNMYYASILGVELGMFYKRRDYSRIVNGNNPIAEHKFLGKSVAGKDVFVADDMISTGTSMLLVAKKLKDHGAKRVFTYATYPFFTDGMEAFDKAYDAGIIDCVLGTNLSYRSPELLKRKWFLEVNVSKYTAYFICAISLNRSIGELLDPNSKIEMLLKRYGR